MTKGSAPPTGALSVAVGTLIAILVAAVWLGTFQLERSDREEALSAGRKRVADASLAAQAHVLQRVQAMDQAARLLRAEWEADRESFPNRAAALRPLLSDALIQVSVIGPDGTLLFSDFDPHARGVDLSDREHFRAHREAADDRLFISKPVLGKVSGQWSVQFARRLRGADGSFGGVVVLSMDPTALTEGHSGFSLGDGAAMTVVGKDGVIRSRVPAIIDGKGWIGTTVPRDRPFMAEDAAPAGAFRGVGAADGTVRLYHWRQLGELPMLVVVHVPEDQLLTGAQQLSHTYRAAANVATLGLSVAGAAIILLGRRQSRVLARLRHAEAAVGRMRDRAQGFDAARGPGRAGMAYRRLAVLLSVLAVLILAVLGAALAALLWTERERALELAESQALFQARAQQAVLKRTLGDFDRDIQVLRRLVERGTDRDAIRLSMAARMRGNPEIMDILVLDGGGRIAVWNRDDAPPDVTDRPYFVEHRNRSEDVLHLSPPLPSKVHAGRYFFSLSRRVSAPDGGFAGAVVFIIAVDHLARSLEGGVQGSDASMAVATLGGITLFRHPRRERDTGTVLPEVAALAGNVPAETIQHVVSPFDGQRRIVAQLRVGDYQLIVGTTLDKDAVLEPHEDKAWLAALLFLAGAAAAGAVTRVVLGLLRGRMAAVESLQVERQRLAAVIEGTNVGTWEWDVPSGRTWFNERWAAIIGRTLDEISPTTIDTWVTFAHPDDLQRSSELLQRHFAGELPYYECECRMRHKDGSWVWVLDRGKVSERAADGSPLRMSGTHADVTRRKRAEELTAAINALQSDFIASTDLRERFAQVLDRCMALTESPYGFIGEVQRGADGTPIVRNFVHDDLAWSEEERRRHSFDGGVDFACTDPEALVGSLLAAAEPVIANGPVADPKGGLPDGHPPLRSFLGIPIFGGETIVAMIGLANRPNGYGPDVVGHLAPLLMACGSVIAAEHARRSEHALLTRLEAQREELSRSNVELEQFAYVASHDLRQPLRMVNSYTQLLEKRMAGRLDGDERTFFDFIRDGAVRMDQMLVSLLEYSRIGRRGEPMAPVSLLALVEEAMHFLEPAIAESGAAIDLSGDWPTVAASGNEMVRLFQNLIGNAIKYRAADRPPVIGLEVVRQNGDWLFTVRDNGIGIDPGQFDRLFKVFQRLHTRDRYEGTGIGLAVCRKIVERHGGRIWVESEGAGQGSRFRFTLPAQPA